MTNRHVRPSGREYLELLKLNRGYLEQSFETIEDDSYEELVKKFARQLMQRHPGEVFVLVVHTGFAELAKIWPHAKFIHILRDPRE